MFKRLTILFFLLGGLTGKNFSQDPEFSQFYNAQLYLNPAFAGVDYGPRFMAIYRNQWPGFDNAYVTYAASYDQHIEALGGGIGIIGVSDRQMNGILNSNSFSGIYSYQINANPDFAMKAAMQVSFVQKSLNSSQLIFSENIDPNTGQVISTGSGDAPDLNSKSFVDFAAGLLFFSSKFFAGVSAKHLSQPNESLNSAGSSPLPLRIAANFGLLFKSPYQSKVYFSPNIIYVQQSTFKQINAGAYLGLGTLYGGAFFRHTVNNSDAIIPQIGVKKGIFKMGYSYDITLSGLQSSSSGAHELALLLNFADSKNAMRRIQGNRFSKCPEPF